MKYNNQFTACGSAMVLAALVSGCASTQTTELESTEVVSSNNTQIISDLEEKNRMLVEREAQLAKEKAMLEEQIHQNNQIALSTGDELLPPDAQPGECYARVWVDAAYETKTETVLISEASEVITTIPAKYETVTEEVLVKEASFYMEEVPVVYGTKQETRLVEEGQRLWKVDLDHHAAPASDELLAAAQKHGIDLDAATPGMCFHEHFIPAQYETVYEDVLIKESYETVSITDAEYRWVEKEVLVSEASTRLEEVPAVYETVTEQIIDKPAHTVWKKGTGPIQRIDEATGEIMCLVEVPATYKTISKRVLKTPATTRTVNIPAEYKTIKVRELAMEPQEIRNTVPAEYKSVGIKKQVADKAFVWHEIHNTEHPASTRTGNKICLTETQPRYETITTTVVTSPASTRRVDVPAEYKTVQVNKLVTSAQEVREEIPAKYDTVTYQELERDGFMEWRSILCETNMTPGTISAIQKALTSKGYNPGPIDGVIGANTIKAVNQFQSDEGLPTDKYINIETVRALGVSL